MRIYEKMVYLTRLRRIMSWPSFSFIWLKKVVNLMMIFLISRKPKSSQRSNITDSLYALISKLSKWKNLAISPPKIKQVLKINLQLRISRNLKILQKLDLLQTQYSLKLKIHKKNQQYRWNKLTKGAVDVKYFDLITSI